VVVVVVVRVVVVMVVVVDVVFVEVVPVAVEVVLSLASNPYAIWASGMYLLDGHSEVDTIG